MEVVKFKSAAFECFKCKHKIQVHDLDENDTVHQSVPCPKCGGEMGFDNFIIEEKPLVDFYCIWWDGRNWYHCSVKAFNREDARDKIESYDYLLDGDTPDKKSVWGYGNHYDLHVAEHNNEKAMEGLFRSIWD